jgi:hypothetical protein
MRLDRLTYEEIQQLKSKTPEVSSAPAYYSVITGQKNSYLADPFAEKPNTVVQRRMSLQDAVACLKKHHKARLTSLNKPEPLYIISKQTMFELNWYPSANLSMMEQFNEYKALYITPERLRRETRFNENYWHWK